MQLIVLSIWEKNVNCKISRLEQITRRILEKVKLMHQEENV